MVHVYILDYQYSTHVYILIFFVRIYKKNTFFFFLNFILSSFEILELNVRKNKYVSNTKFFKNFCMKFNDKISNRFF